MLALMKVPQPREMTGHSLLSERSRQAVLAVPHQAAAASA
jgi:2,3-bisphosphoglycerate-independent phosphoglycerate mutase